MDFPLFFLDDLGNRLMFAIIAITHVLINHPLAVGAYPLVTALEWWAYRKNRPDIDNLARKVTFVLFVVTTSVGALTGVGIWLSAALVAPFGIGSLLRIFFWAWFAEWLVFVSEVILILVYYLAWKRWASGTMKKVHIGVGVLLSVMSWFTMAIIVAILGFMMGTGDWVADHNFFSAFFNPLYFPQLLFRTTYALLGAGLFVWFLLYFFTEKGSDLRDRTIRFVATWVLALSPFCAAGAYWYWSRVPSVMQANLDVALLTQKYMQWEGTFLTVVEIVLAVVLLFAITAAIRPKLIPHVALIIPFVFGLYLLGHFERTREFLRKPHVVADYMYSNGVRMDELPVLKRDGMLRHATYVGERQITSVNKLQAGKDVFMLACSRCHTTTGVNGVYGNLTALYGSEPWDEMALVAFVDNMHNTRTFMPPFPGSEPELDALVAFLLDLQKTKQGILGAQTGGVKIPPSPAEGTAQLQPASN
ncbi:c-type cytochrome [bacterium]|nr:c-type cytochrome [bacterium]MCB2202343.1 c-type cytochrome [bacterium]